MRLLDLGCGPGSITAGLGTRSIGVDVRAVAVPGVPVVGGDGARLPFPDASFDAVYANAVLQHVPDAAAVVREVRRVVRPGAVVGVGDVDWDARLVHPADPLLERGARIQEALREGGDVRVGRRLRELLTGAGFERIEVAVTGRAVGTAQAVAAAASFEAAWFEAPAAVDHVSELGLSDPEEMAAVAAAWHRWGTDPGACSATCWFTALAWAPGPPAGGPVRSA